MNSAKLYEQACLKAAKHGPKKVKHFVNLALYVVDTRWLKDGAKVIGEDRMKLAHALAIDMAVGAEAVKKKYIFQGALIGAGAIMLAAYLYGKKK